MISYSLKRAVHREATNLRRYATDEEKENLHFGTLNPDSKVMCVYGQMTGNCFSKRANELIMQCAVPVTEDTDIVDRYGLSVFTTPTTVSVKNWLKNTWSKFINKKKDTRKAFTALEYYIAQKENKSLKNKQLLQYIKGERDTFIA